ncbi:peptidylprolyl isomerase [Catenovulum adriaticum]|uniref:Peptidyl-prolyl cis-trans isomerase n=1 Tax=Catenovulum adriaticum TaxID=2984846 RepID=A0ABY7ANJ9_9ALTE|nr:peptidylprolyl isomerase [Catenovulum sp. TS8]WAJ71128.1 peptidylprolyl isomerase [Catenovulum sp. TS8]
MKYQFPKLLLIAITFIFSQFSALAKPDTQDSNLYPSVKISTSMGDIVVELNRRKAPITVANFIEYVVNGDYNGTVFHRVIDGFIAQSGGYDKNYEELKKREPIFNESGNGLTNDRMTIAMARMNDPHSAARQFYFNLADNQNLDPGRNWGYCVFGIVLEGEAVVEAIAKVETNFNETFGAADVPVKQITINEMTLLPRP